MTQTGLVLLLVLVLVAALTTPPRTSQWIDCTSTPTHGACTPTPTPGPSDVERMGRR